MDALYLIALGGIPLGLLGGPLGGIGGFTGTVPTLWCTLRGFERDSERAVIQNFNLSMLLVTLLTYLGTGVVTRNILPAFGCCWPWRCRSC
ncbi:hypothetical protein [Pseudomonas sp. CC120222-01a]|uniref:hypothetical protein n=1 Tax=Pseudomonas sp. CC120222-01a TaxID=1378075 RepID=UPI000D811B23|nr:hypothetical protein [Pseudomonas sp. CC120222-01a]PVZ42478.1 hypothetical protein N430_01091 [Pseudomonas sp. CC120222-01a]